VLAVRVGLGLDRVVDAADRPAHEVEVALVLELHLREALAVHARGTDLVVARTGPAVERPQDRLDDRALARAVGAVDADQARRQLELELVLVDPVVAQEQSRQPHRALPAKANRRHIWRWFAFARPQALTRPPRPPPAPGTRGRGRGRGRGRSR